MSGNRLVWNRAETPAEINRMLSVLAEEYPVADCGDGMRIRFEKIAEPGVLRMAAEPGTIVIQYGSLQAAARGVGNALAGRTVSGDMVFKTLGIMLDCSRNAVMKVSYLKKWLRRLTLLGYNMVMLYTEDTYQLPEEPYFGYLRGGYSLEEMREIDAYASGLGIEMIGCIQTLGHLEHIIRWHAFPNDSERVLLVDDDRTYALIGKMLDFWGKAFKSRRIHVGMDETHDLGRGRFMDLHGYERGFDIFNRHLGRVNEMCKERGLNPIIWSDMYFRMGNKELSYYDKSTVIPEDVRKKIPSNVTLCYWDYYHRDQEFYEDWIQRHRALGFDPHMGSGVWTWVCMWYDHEQTVNTVTPCLNACRKEKVSEVYFTMWGDNGAYCDYDSSLAGLAWAADLAWGGKGADETVAPVFEAVCGASYREQITASEMQLACKVKDDVLRVYTSLILWDDPLLGIVWREYRKFDENIWNLVLDRVREVRTKLAPSVEHREAGDIGHAWNLCDLVAKKIEMRFALLKAYEAGDRAELMRIRNCMVPEVIAAFEAVDATFRRQWMRRNKPFGLEIMQIRFAGQIARYKEAARRIGELLEGTVDSIPELEVKVENPVGVIDGRYGRNASGCLI